MCTPAIESTLADPAAMDLWKQTTTDRLNALAALSTPTDTDLQKVLEIQKDVSAMTACISQKLNATSSTSSTIFSLEKQVGDNEAILVERNKDIQVARDRAAWERNPELTKSYYDGWFPLFRPLKHYTVPILIAVALFFLALTFFYFLAFMGLDIRMFMFLPSMPDGSIGSSRFGKPFWAMTAIATILLGLTIYGFTR